MNNLICGCWVRTNNKSCQMSENTSYHWLNNLLFDHLMSYAKIWLALKTILGARYWRRCPAPPLSSGVVQQWSCLLGVDSILSHLKKAVCSLLISGSPASSQFHMGSKKSSLYAWYDSNCFPFLAIINLPFSFLERKCICETLSWINAENHLVKQFYLHKDLSQEEISGHC